MQRGRRPHLLYVAWGFPPSRGGGVFRALATANAFQSAGWDVTVLTADRAVFLEYTGADEALEERVHPDIRIVRVPFRWSAQETDVSRYSLLRAASPAIWSRMRTRLDRLHFPEVAYGPWRPAIERAAHEVHRQRPVDLVIGTANPNVDFTPGLALHRSHGVPYVMDYRDAWMINIFTGERVHPPGSRAARWEKQLVGSAQEIWFVNAPIRDWHAAEYPSAAERMHVVENGYDEDFVHPVERRRRPDEPLRFGYIGTISPRVPVAEFVRGWRHARERSPLVARATAHLYGHLGYYASVRTETAQTLEQARDAGVYYEGPVPKTEVARTYAGFDALLLIMGTGRYVTSGKTYEYLATGLPMTSVHDPGNATRSTLEGHPLWFSCEDLGEKAVSEALIATAEAAAAADPALREQALTFAHRYRRENQLGPRIEALAGTVARRAGTVTV
ncbi:MAG: glycosyltransferase [Actinomycetes bacterium]